MTGSTLSTSEITKQVLAIPNLIRNAICPEVNKMILERNLPFDKAFPLVKAGFNKLANKNGIDPAVLFWIYMEWKR